jgi:glutathione S-transferase
MSPDSHGDKTMKIYYHPVSTTSRPVMLFAMENGISTEFQVVDLMKGEHMQGPFASMNPTRLVPLLEDGDFRLSESSAILKYLAEKIGSPAYPKDLRQRARVNEMMDWINTQVCRDYAYGLVYPQIFPTHKRPSDEQQKGQLAWAKERAQGWLTIADYFGVSFVGLGEIIRQDYAAYPNVNRWINTMKAMKSWPKVYEVFYGFAGSMKDVKFETA